MRVFLGETTWERYLFGDRELRGVVIPFGDIPAYQAFPRFRWMFDKLRVAQTQGIVAHPHGIEPTRFPVFSKPVYNLYGLSEGARVLRRWTDAEYRPGHFWMELFEGPQYSTDFAVVEGEPVWDCTFEGHRDARRGGFTHWELVPAARTGRALDPVRCWIREWMRGYTGIMNAETIQGRIIEAHPRLSTQFVDFYGAGWIDAVVRLYTEGCWTPVTSAARGYSVVVKADRPGIWKCDRSAALRLAGEPGVRSVVGALLAPEDRRRPDCNLDLNLRLGVLAVDDLAHGRRVARRLRRAFALVRAARR